MKDPKTTRFTTVLVGIAVVAAVLLTVRFYLSPGPDGLAEERRREPQLPAAASPQTPATGAEVPADGRTAPPPPPEPADVADTVSLLPGNPIAVKQARFEDARVVAVREHLRRPDGTMERVRLVETELQYPLIRVVETLVLDRAAKTTHVAGAVAMVADHIIVKLRPGITEEELVAFNRLYGAEIRKRMSAPATYLVEFPHAEIDTIVNAIAAYGDEANLVAYAEPDYVVYAVATPNDPRYTELWGMNNTGQTGGTPDADIDAPEAWNTGTGNNVLVAVIDTGVDYNHEDLAANIWVNPGEIPDNGIDDDGNGYADDIHGIDVVNSDSDPKDDHDHGTHCSGTIAGIGDNGIGVVGVCWSARVMGLKFLSAGGYGLTSGAIECIDYGTMMGARVMNNSWGGGGYSQALCDAIERANQSNVVFCAAAGNSASNNDGLPHYPSSCTNANVIAVAASDHNDALSVFSCYGATSVDLAAPGSAILSTIADDRYTAWDGTSMATPHCSGAAALLLSLNPQLTAAQVKAALMNNVDPKPAFAGKMVTGGRLNVAQAIESIYGISFDKNEYFTDSWGAVMLTDTNVLGLGSYTVALATDGGDAESLTLHERSPGDYVMTNRFWIAYGPVTPGNDSVEGVHGTVITCTYSNGSRVLRCTAVVNLELDITISTPVMDVPYATTNFQVAGVNNGNVHVDMVVSNEATGETHPFTATNGWTAPVVALATNQGQNTIWVLGTNIYGHADRTSVQITRLSPAGTTNYVAKAGGHRWPFLTWNTAATNMAAAIDVAATNNVILVTNDTYAGAEIVVDRPVTLRGVQGAAATIIDGEHARRCISVLVPGALVDGFTLTRGYSENGGGAHMLGGELRNCIVKDNGAWSFGGGVYCETAGSIVSCMILTNDAYDGGGIEFDHGGTVSNSVIRGNYSYRYGGGADCYGDGKIYNCVVTHNYAGWYGGGIECWDGGEVHNSRVMYNEAGGDGGGVECYYGTGITINNSFIGGNLAWGYGGGVDCWSGGTLNNCTVVDNAASYGGGLYCYYGGDVRNTVVYYNQASTGDNHYNHGVGWFSYQYSCTTPGVAGAGNITNIPSLTGIADPHLLAASPCIDAGTNAFATGTDIDGQTRISGGTVDIGCDEWVAGGSTGSLVVAIDVNATNVCVDYPLDFAADIQGIALEYTWNFADGALATNVPVLSHSWGATGAYPVVLTALNADYPAGISATVTIHVVSRTTYVSPAGSHSPPFDSWAAAATNIQSAVDAAPYGGLVLVTDGVYRVNSHTANGMPCRAGLYKPITVRSINGPGATVIEGEGPAGDGAMRCAYLVEHAVLSGFTLTNGHTKTSGDSSYERSGGGALLDYGGLLTNCIVIGNAASFRGGGVYLYNGGRVDDCVVSRNHAQIYAGGVFCYYAGDVGNSDISANDSDGYAGGLHCYYGGSASRCTIVSNSAAWYGGGARITSGASLDNCLVYGNHATLMGGGVYGYYGGEIDSCTIAGNDSARGGGIYLRYYVTVRNTIVRENTAPTDPNCYNYGSGWTYEHCALDSDPGGTGNTTNAPLLRDGCRLDALSPCVDAGTNQAWMAASTDLAGDARIFNGVVDIGAYELADTDGDGLPDYWEAANGTDPLVPDAGDDPDADGLTNLDEYQNHTNPINPDTDGDGWDDGTELQVGTDPLDVTDFPVVSVTITGPTAADTYTTTNSTIDLSGTLVCHAAVTNMLIINNRDIAPVPCVPDTNWTVNGLQLYSGLNHMTVTVWDAAGNLLTDTVTVNYTGDDRYGDVLWSGALVQDISFPATVTPGVPVTVRWKTLSYVPLRARLGTGSRTDGWFLFKNARYTGSTNSSWNIGGRNATVYSFECEYTAPTNVGDFSAWFNHAQTDGGRYMAAVIPDGADPLDQWDPLQSKLITRTIVAGGTNVNPQSDAAYYDSVHPFETLDQALMRSGSTIIHINVPTNQWTTGQVVTAEWTVLAYAAPNSKLSIIDLAQKKIWHTTPAAVLVATKTSSWHIGPIYAVEYTFRASFVVPSQPGTQQIYFLNRRAGVAGSSWMAGNIPAGVDPRPVFYNGMYGRFIDRDIGP